MTAEPVWREYESWSEAGEALGKFWLRELTEKFGDRLPPFFEKEQHIIEIHPDAYVISRLERGRATELAQFQKQQDLSNLAAQIAKFKSAHDLDRGILLRLGEDIILRPCLKLPFGGRGELQGAIRYELERLSPVDPADLCLDFSTEKAAKRGRLTDIRIRAVRRSALDEIIAVCKAAGFGISGILLGRDKKPASWRDFPLDRVALTHSLWRKYSLAILASLSAILFTACLFVAYAREANALDRLYAKVAQASIGAASTAGIQREIDRTNRQINFLLSARQKPLSVGLLADVTKTIPEDSWLTNLEVVGSRLHLQGYSKNAAALINLFGKSARFSNARFTAPVTKDSHQQADRFDITVDITGSGP